jgi:hypothetical protein
VRADGFNQTPFLGPLGKEVQAKQTFRVDPNRRDGAPSIEKYVSAWFGDGQQQRLMGLARPGRVCCKFEWAAAHADMHEIEMTAGTCFEWEDFRIAVDNICGGVWLVLWTRRSAYCRIWHNRAGH